MLDYSKELKITPAPTPTFSLIPTGTYMGEHRARASSSISGSGAWPQDELSASMVETGRDEGRSETQEAQETQETQETQERERKRALISQLLVDTPHDGQLIPKPFWDDMMERVQDPSAVERVIREHYTLERDWGASLVADALGVALQRRGYPLAGHYRSHIARVLLDFARFPGSTPRRADHLSRFAINYPSSQYLGHEHKQLLLERHYDTQSALLEPLMGQTRIKLALHTYDTYSASGTLRPCVSVINRPISYQLESLMPLGSFDPIYPVELLEHTADRRLTYRLTLAFEEAGLSASHNYPYLLPNGSIEVRSQVWHFFRFLRARFELERPDTAQDASYLGVWDLLLDTNLRSTQSEDLRSYLHMFRRAPEHLTSVYIASRHAYETIRTFFEARRVELLRTYRADPWRLSAFAFEVRKDCVWRFADEACRVPLEPHYDQITQIAGILADALIAYLESSPEVVFERALTTLRSGGLNSDER